MFPFREFRRNRTMLAPHEVVEFYPSYGFRADDAHDWRLAVQGGVFNPKLPWFRRRPVMAMIRRAMRVDRGADEYFRRRMQRFLLSSAAGRQITIRLAGQTYAAGESGPAGLFKRQIDVSEDQISRSLETPDDSGKWISYSAVLPQGDQREFTGRIQLVEAEGFSIVSDVDDTIKHSNVPNRRDLFHNTFSRKFSPIPGMADIYRQCARAGAVFHFVSGSPWQLYEPLAEFFRDHGFPPGSFHLKPFRIRDTARKIRGPSSQLSHKRSVIEPILATFPRRKFVLVGDSGEQDPSIYGGFLRDCGEQVARVFIRAVSGETADHPRLQAAFAGCPADRWRLYRDPEEIRDELLRLVTLPELPKLA